MKNPHRDVPSIMQKPSFLYLIINQRSHVLIVRDVFKFGSTCLANSESIPRLTDDIMVLFANNGHRERGGREGEEREREIGRQK